MGKRVIGAVKETAQRNILIKKETNKAREVVMQSGKRKEAR
jgi:hypothetical protein